MRRILCVTCQISATNHAHIGTGMMARASSFTKVRSGALSGLIVAVLGTPLAARAQEIAHDSPVLTALTPGVADARNRAIACLSTAIVYEAAHEPVEGQQAVAEVILNRVRNPAYPKSVCGVVFAGSERRTGCQFSFTCDGSLDRQPAQSVMALARMVAAAALDGHNPVRVSGATHYHANYVSPYWAPSLIRIARIGAHIFYRGAGTRDSGMVAKNYVPSGEPVIGRIGTAQSTTLPALPMLRPNPLTRPAAPALFSPWGLSTITAAGG